eukprot:726575-Pyramimonas_sp.AAC.1
MRGRRAPGGAPGSTLSLAGGKPQACPSGHHWTLHCTGPIHLSIHSKYLRIFSSYIFDSGIHKSQSSVTNLKD